MREEINNWWMQAKRDFLSAKNSYNSNDYYASVFWCQQSLEKSLKAYIMFSKKVSKDPLNSHSLIKLAIYAKIPKKFHKFLRMMSPEYYMTRYPDASEMIPYNLYDEEDNKLILKETGEFIEWLELQMKE